MSSIKVVVVGDDGVGKTTMLIVYTTRSFPAEYTPTVFDNYSSGVAALRVTFSLWDTAGGAVYDALRPLSYPQTDIFLVCYSVASHTSLENAKKKFVPEIKTNCPNTKFILVATKLDLRNDPATAGRLQERNLTPISFSEGAAAAKELEADGFLECSSLTQEGLDKVFDSALTIIRSTNTEKKQCIIQ